MTEQSSPAAGGDNPQAQASAGPKGFGGWLILPMLGTILSPLWLAYQVLQTAAALERATSSSLKVFVAGEVVFNLGLMVAWVVAIFRLFKRKRSYPRLFVTLVALTFLGIVCDLAIAVGVSTCRWMRTISRIWRVNSGRSPSGVRTCSYPNAYETRSSSNEGVPISSPKTQSGQRTKAASIWPGRSSTGKMPGRFDPSASCSQNENV